MENVHRKKLVLRTVGFVLSLFLTLTAYFIIIQPDYFNLSQEGVLIAIFGLAVLQFTVQFVFFLNLWKEKGPLWNLGVFASTLSIIFIIIFFSIWIMHHLNYNMMPNGM